MGVVQSDVEDSKRSKCSPPHQFKYGSFQVWQVGLDLWMVGEHDHPPENCD